MAGDNSFREPPEKQAAISGDAQGDNLNRAVQDMQRVGDNTVGTPRPTDMMSQADMDRLSAGVTLASVQDKVSRFSNGGDEDGQYRQMAKTVYEQMLNKTA